MLYNKCDKYTCGLTAKQAYHALDKVLLLRETEENNVSQTGDAEHPTLNTHVEQLNRERKVAGIWTSTFALVEQLRRLQLVQNL